METYVIHYDDEDLEKEGWEYNYQPYFLLKHELSYTSEQITEFVEQAIEQILIQEKKVFDLFADIQEILIEQYGFEPIKSVKLNVTEALVEAVKKMDEF